MTTTTTLFKDAALLHRELHKIMNRFDNAAYKTSDDGFGKIKTSIFTEEELCTQQDLMCLLRLAFGFVCNVQELILEEVGTSGYEIILSEKGPIRTDFPDLCKTKLIEAVKVLAKIEKEAVINEDKTTD